MANQNDSFVTPGEPSDPVANMPGTYKDDVASMSQEERSLNATLPKAPDPSPFKLGPMASGGR